MLVESDTVWDKLIAARAGRSSPSKLIEQMSSRIFGMRSNLNNQEEAAVSTPSGGLS